MILKILKHLIFHQSDADAERISKAVFNLDELENLLGTGSYFDEKVGETDDCLTRADIVESVYRGDREHPHLAKCLQCREAWRELQDNFQEGDKDDEETIIAPSVKLDEHKRDYLRKPLSINEKQEQVIREPKDTEAKGTIYR